MTFYDDHIDDEDYDEAYNLGSLAADCDQRGTYAVVYADGSYQDGIATREEADRLMADGARLLSPHRGSGDVLEGGVEIRKDRS